MNARIAITQGDASTYEALKKEYNNSTSVDGKEICLQSMGRVQTPELARDYFNFLMKEVAVQDVHSGAMALSANGKTRHTLWECIKENWDLVYDRLSENKVVIDRFLRVSLNKFAEESVEKDIEKFFEKKDNSGYDRSLGVVKDTIRGNAQYYEREEKILLEWLNAKDYA